MSKHTKFTFHKQQGFAMVTVLLIVALLSLLGINYVQRYQLTQITTTYSGLHGQLQEYIWSVENIALHALNKSDDISQQLLHIEHALAAQDITAAATIKSVDGYFNVNNLLAMPPEDSPYLAVLLQLLSNHNDAVDKTQQLQQYINEQYQQGRNPKQGWVSWQDFFDEAGIEIVDVSLWHTLLIALPANVPINLNLADPKLLQALLPDLTTSDLDGLMRQKANREFIDTNDFLRALGHIGYSLSAVEAQQLAKIVGTENHYFLLNLALEYGRLGKQVAILINKDDDFIRVIGRQIKALNTSENKNAAPQ